MKRSGSTTSRALKRPTRRNDPAGMRRVILDAAFNLFQSRGYNGTSMQDLMEATATTAGALHHHFPTKRSIALAVFTERVAPAVRETWIEPVRSAEQFDQGVYGVFAEIFGGIEARGAVTGCPLNNLAMELSLVDPEFREAAAAIFKEWQDALTDRLQTTRAGGKLSKAARTEIASFVISAYSGAIALAKTEQSAASMRHTAQILRRWLQAQKLDR